MKKSARNRSCWPRDAGTVSAKSYCRIPALLRRVRDPLQSPIHSRCKLIFRDLLREISEDELATRVYEDIIPDKLVSKYILLNFYLWQVFKLIINRWMIFFRNNSGHQ
jgi:hypothetical protein